MARTQALYTPPLPKLTRDSFLQWKNAIACLLKINGLFDVVTNDPHEGLTAQQKAEREILDNKSRLLLIGSLESTGMPLVANSEMAKVLWSALTNKYGGNSLVQINILKREFLSIRLKENESREAFLDQIMMVAAKIKSTGYQLSDPETQVAILCGLPKS